MNDNKSIVVLFDVIEEKENQNELSQLNLLNGSIDHIANESQKEVDSLNRFLDNTIALIDENNMLYDEYMGQILTAKEQYSDIADKITDWKEKKIRAKKLADTADKGVKAQEVVEKVNTISMSLNPVAAALQFAAKILRTELDFPGKNLS